MVGETSEAAENEPEVAATWRVEWYAGRLGGIRTRSGARLLPETPLLLATRIVSANLARVDKLT